METLYVIGLLTALLLSRIAASAESNSPQIAAAAQMFLASLDAKQRQSVLFAFDDEQQRARWSNFPTGFVHRAGTSLRELRAEQRTSLMALLALALSPRGMEKVQQIMASDEANKTLERNNPLFGGDLYYVSILGIPSESGPWMLQFGVHHLAINLTMVGDREVLTPTLTGAQPAQFTFEGKSIRPLGQESDKAVALLKSLGDAERKQAVLNYRVTDLVLGPGQDGKIIQPEGLKASVMTETQRSLLPELIAEWTGIVNDVAAAARMSEIKSDFNETWFAWSGSTDVTAGKNIASYYRIQGPKLLIEFSPQRMGGDAAMHVHTIYRDPTNDYGRLLRKNETQTFHRGLDHRCNRDAGVGAPVG